MRQTEKLRLVPGGPEGSRRPKRPQEAPGGGRRPKEEAGGGGGEEGEEDGDEEEEADEGEERAFQHLSHNNPTVSVAIKSSSYGPQALSGGDDVESL